MKQLVCAMCVAASTWSTAASAQTTDAARPSKREAAVTSQATVSVAVDGQSEPLRGTLLSVDATTVQLLINGAPRTVALSTVSRIERPGDSLTNGFLIGFGALGGWCAYICGQGLGRGVKLVAGVAVNGLLGGAIGAWFDASHTGTTTLLRRPRARLQAAFQGRSISLSIQF
jgi:hypothetical protein